MSYTRDMSRETGDIKIAEEKFVESGFQVGDGTRGWKICVVDCNVRGRRFSGPRYRLIPISSCGLLIRRRIKLNLLLFYSINHFFFIC